MKGNDKHCGEEVSHSQTFSKNGTSSEGRFNRLTKSFLTATMPQVIATSSFISFIWLLLYIFFLIVLLFQAFLTLRDYYSYPVNVEITINTSSKSLEFPAVTLCNNNMVKKNLLARIPKYKELAALSDVVHQQNLPERNRDTQVLTNWGFYQCRDSPDIWIPGSWMCNGKTDCPGGLDEEFNKCATHHPVNFSQNCLEGFEKCPSESTCAILCDGINDCVLDSGYDESRDKGCPTPDDTQYLTAGDLPHSLSSPNFPKKYANNLIRNYVIETSEGYVIQLNVMAFHVEECDRTLCWCDFLTILDGNGEFFTFNGATRMCGEISDIAPIESSTNQLTISFSSDYVNAHEGWFLLFKRVSKTQSPQSSTSHQVGYQTVCTTSLSEIPSINIESFTTPPGKYLLIRVILTHAISRNVRIYITNLFCSVPFASL